MRPRDAYKDMSDNVVSPITFVTMNHQNQLEQMANRVMFATICPIYSWLSGKEYLLAHQINTTPTPKGFSNRKVVILYDPTQVQKSIVCVGVLYHQQ
jgi:hypothetical protein